MGCQMQGRLGETGSPWAALIHGHGGICQCFRYSLLSPTEWRGEERESKAQSDVWVLVRNHTHWAESLSRNHYMTHSKPNFQIIVAMTARARYVTSAYMSTGDIQLLRCGDREKKVHV